MVIYSWISTVSKIIQRKLAVIQRPPCLNWRELGKSILHHYISVLTSVNNLVWASWHRNIYLLSHIRTEGSEVLKRFYITSIVYNFQRLQYEFSNSLISGRVMLTLSAFFSEYEIKTVEEFFENHWRWTIWYGLYLPWFGAVRTRTLSQ